MKHSFLLIIIIVMVSAMAVAQATQGATPTTTGAPGAVGPTIDVLGAHQNYGRGCAGCHAPHSGGFGAGGNGTGNQTVDPYSGSNALFAQEMGPLWGQTFDFSDISNAGSANRYLLATAANGNPTTMSSQQYSDMRGVVMCLACHDGAVAKGAMMQNWAFEEQIGALPSTYGTGKIPTLLGADGTTNLGNSTDGGNYNNDHPIGENATISAVLGNYYNNATNGLNYTVTNGTITAVTYAGQYSQFVTSYGAPALLKGAHSYATPVNVSNVPYVVCTTCHDQHSMNVYSVVGAANPIAGSATGTYTKYFFINGPYNPDTVNVPIGKAASTTQFCRQCHFGESNEANGGTLATTF
ncbi:MAG: hypothetical protein WCF48_10025 [Terriglobales bacterium]